MDGGGGERAGARRDEVGRTPAREARVTTPARATHPARATEATVAPRDPRARGSDGSSDASAGRRGDGNPAADVPARPSSARNRGDSSGDSTAMPRPNLGSSDDDDIFDVAAPRAFL